MLRLETLAVLQAMARGRASAQPPDQDGTVATRAHRIATVAMFMSERQWVRA